jgi:hypothetical protein
MNPIKSIIKFFWNDFVTDIKAIKDMFTDKEKNEQFFEKLRKALFTGWIEYFQKNGTSIFLFALLLSLAFFSGWFVSAKHYQNVCNEYIYEKYILPDINLRILNQSQEYETYDFRDLNFTIFDENGNAIS